MRVRGDQDLQHLITASAQHKVLAIIVDHSDFISNSKEDLILKMPSAESLVRMANSIVGASSATSTHSIISVNVEDPISEVSVDGTEVAHREEVATAGRASKRQRNAYVGRGRGEVPDAGTRRGVALDAGRGRA